MHSEAKTIGEYLEDLPEDRKIPMKKLMELLRGNLPPGYDEKMMYGMINFIVPLETYPPGYHVSKGKDPLSFIGLASQKNYIALYHSGIYGKPELEEWFRKEYKERATTKLDMGKSCIRFKNMDQIPYELIEELAKKITVEEYIKMYEQARNA